MQFPHRGVLTSKPSTSGRTSVHAEGCAFSRRQQRYLRPAVGSIKRNINSQQAHAAFESTETVVADDSAHRSQRRPEQLVLGDAHVSGGSGRVAVFRAQKSATQPVTPGERPLGKYCLKKSAGIYLAVSTCRMVGVWLL
jgi:hypothetical protein